MSNLPYLPGFVDNRHRAGPRPQKLFISKDGPVDKKYDSDVPQTYEDAEDRFTTTSCSYGSPDGPAAMAKTNARFVEMDKKVLRVYAYFQEAVTESAVESARIRRCHIMYYLVDDTITIIEPKIQNSGIPQGTFVKRHVLLKDDGSPVCWQELLIGSELTVYGRVFRICDCDAYTRQWFVEHDVPQIDAEPWPVDSFAAVSIEESKEKVKVPNPLKKFMEAALGKASSAQIDLRQFLELDRKVLRFDCSWDDTESLYGDEIRFILHYFLADDTVEIRELHTANNGKDKFPMMVSRKKLPIDWNRSMRETGFTRRDEGAASEDYISAKDLVVGKHIDVFGRSLLLEDCDGFTRAWFKDRLDFAQPAAILREDNSVVKREFVPPPSTGFGSEEDSLSSCMQLIAKPPKKDWSKFMSHDGKVLRFSAKMVTTVPEDKERRFVIQYFLADDSIMVFEPTIRNSGISGGKFLARAKWKKEDDTAFTIEDFLPGQVTKLFHREWEIFDSDEYTKKYLAEREEKC